MGNTYSMLGGKVQPYVASEVCFDGGKWTLVSIYDLTDPDTDNDLDLCTQEAADDGHRLVVGGDADMARVVDHTGRILWHSDGNGPGEWPDDGSTSDALAQRRNDARIENDRGSK